jgi:hypothetical protein
LDEKKALRSRLFLWEKGRELPEKKGGKKRNMMELLKGGIGGLLGTERQLAIWVAFWVILGLVFALSQPLTWTQQKSLHRLKLSLLFSLSTATLSAEIRSRGQRNSAEGKKKQFQSKNRSENEPKNELKGKKRKKAKR